MYYSGMTNQPKNTNQTAKTPFPKTNNEHKNKKNNKNNKNSKNPTQKGA
jgi:hypothetical protein